MIACRILRHRACLLGPTRHVEAQLQICHVVCIAFFSTILVAVVSKSEILSPILKGIQMIMMFKRILVVCNKRHVFLLFPQIQILHKVPHHAQALRIRQFLKADQVLFTFWALRSASATAKQAAASLATVFPPLPSPATPLHSLCPHSVLRRPSLGFLKACIHFITR